MKIEKKIKAYNFSHTKVSIWQGPFESHKFLKKICLFFSGQQLLYIRGATECLGSLQDDLWLVHFKNFRIMTLAKSQHCLGIFYPSHQVDISKDLVCCNH